MPHVIEYTKRRRKVDLMPMSTCRLDTCKSASGATLWCLRRDCSRTLPCPASLKIAVNALCPEIFPCMCAPKLPQLHALLLPYICINLSALRPNNRQKHHVSALLTTSDYHTGLAGKQRRGLSLLRLVSAWKAVSVLPLRSFQYRI